MRTFWVVLATAAIACGSAGFAAAQDSSDQPTPPAGRSEGMKKPNKAQHLAMMKLMAKELRLRADLIDAQCEDKVDKAKVEKLKKELKAIHTEMQKFMPRGRGFGGPEGRGQRRGPPSDDDSGFGGPGGGPGGPGGGPGGQDGPGGPSDSDSNN
jgi:hypothetical protein